MSAALGTTDDKLTAEEEAALRQMRDDEGVEQQAPQEQLPTAEPQPGEEAEVPARRGDVSAALVEERNRARDLQRRLSETERKAAADQARIEERLRLLAEAAQAHVAPPAAPAPDFGTDPVGAIQHGFREMQERLAQVDARVRSVETGTGTSAAQQAEMRQIQELSEWGRVQEEQYAAGVPDYREAMNFLVEMRARQAQAMPGSNPQLVQAAIRNDIVQIAHMARQQNANLGQVLYSLAEASGYRRGNNNGNNNHGSAAGDNAAERLLRGQDMATSLGSTGAAPRGELAASRVANMSDAEFTELYDGLKKRGGAALRSLLGT